VFLEALLEILFTSAFGDTADIAGLAAGRVRVENDPQRTSATWAVALFVRHGKKRFSSHKIRICIAPVQESADYSHKAVEGLTFVQATGLTSLKVGPFNAIILSNTRLVFLQRPASNRRFPP
jgi:hypothetical protein